MANEFKHKDPGGELTQAEFIAACGDGHIFACQATGDIVYASSTTVLSKLAKAAAGTILNMGGSCIPAWTATPTIGSTSWCNAGHAHAASNSGGTVCANVLAGTTLKSCVVSSSLTSVGTLTALTVDDVAVNGKVVTMTGSACDTIVMTAAANGAFSLVTTDTAAAAANIVITADGTVDVNSAGLLTLDSGAAINIEPAACSVILLDGTISIDAGVVTGATSITSTAFVGTIDGVVGGNTPAAITGTTLTVDNFTLNGTELDLSSGDFALDVAGDVEINADGGCINFKDASLALAAIVNTSCVGELRIHEAANYVGFKAPALSANQTWTLPAAVACCACDVLTCNGSGVLSWATAGGGGGACAIQMNDNVNIAYGTGSDSTISYDGTNTIWRPQAVGSGHLKIQEAHGGSDQATLFIESYKASASALHGGRLGLAHSGNATIGSHTITGCGYNLGLVDFMGSDGDSFEVGARIRADAMEDWSCSQRGSTLSFFTNASGDNNLNNRMKIDFDGGIFMYSMLNAGASTDVNRNGCNELHTVSSSAEFKRDIVPMARIDSSVLQQFQMKDWVWDENSGNAGDEDFGLIVECVYPIAPEVVNLRSDFIQVTSADGSISSERVPDTERPYSFRTQPLLMLAIAEIQRLDKRLVAIGG
jgi:hypothetical protein